MSTLFSRFLATALAFASASALVFADDPTRPVELFDVAQTPVGQAVAFTTTGDQSQLFRRSFLTIADENAAATEIAVALDPSEKFQTLDGFGAAITGSTAYNLFKMTPEDRRALLVETFDPTVGLGFGFVRVSIGCSDFSLSEFSLCEKPGIENFALSSEDREYVIPALKEILAINPNLKILASPWTCPPWMKVEDLESLRPFKSWTSGRLNPKYYDDYATYFVKYVEAMKAEGVEIYAITMQNEPLHRGNSASLYMTWQEQREFVKVLGPKMREAFPATKIIAFDHNFNYDVNKPECRDQFGYPLRVYEDPEAAQYLAGAAYHAYGGDVSEMKRVRDARPDKELYFTEQSIGDWGYSFEKDLTWFTREISIGTLEADCRGVIVWNFMLDTKRGPFRPGGCNKCFGAVNLSAEDFKTVERYSHFYDIAHLAKAFAPDSRRIASTVETKDGVDGFRCVAAQNPDGTLAVVALNDSNEKRSATIRFPGGSFVAELPAKSAASYRWEP